MALDVSTPSFVGRCCLSSARCMEAPAAGSSSHHLHVVGDPSAGGLSQPVLLHVLSYLHNAMHLQLLTDNWKINCCMIWGEITVFSNQAETSSVGVTVTSAEHLDDALVMMNVCDGETLLGGRRWEQNVHGGQGASKSHSHLQWRIGVPASPASGA